MKLPISIMAAGLGACVLTTPIIAAETTSEQVVTVTKTDFKGRPPFKRRSETLPVEDVASLETPTMSSGEYVTVTTVDFRGKPPFKRRTERLPVEDIASYESELAGSDGENVSKFHGKPPYRR